MNPGDKVQFRNPLLRAQLPGSIEIIGLNVDESIMRGEPVLDIVYRESGFFNRDTFIAQSMLEPIP